jgi:membrane-bound serine protease (ClpP class)
MPTMVWVVVTLAFLLLAVAIYLAALSRNKKTATLDLPLNGAQARVEKRLDPEGTIMVQGELWRARSRSGQAIETNSLVLIVGTHDHLLLVERIE